MYNHEPKNYICPFCQIVKGQPTERGSQEGSVVFRNDQVTLFICGKWWRSNPGHLLLVPNMHFENIYDLPDELGHVIFDYSKKASVALKQAYGCEGTSIRQHNEPAGNQGVMHYHMHIFPRYTEDNLYLNHKDTYWPTPEEIKPYAEKLIAVFKNNA